MEKDLYLTESEIMTDNGLIQQGKLVYCSTANRTTTIITMGRNNHCTIPAGNAPHFLKRCKASCGKNYTMMMILDTSYHVYTAIGRDLTAMYEKIVQMYNNNAGTRFTLDDFATSEHMETEHMRIYRIKNDLIWFDDEYYALPDIKNCLGDYFSLYRDSN